MNKLSQRARAITSAITAGLIVFAVALTGLLAYRAFDASRAQQQMTERTLRDYAGFAAFQLKGATIGRIMSLNFQALEPAVRWINAQDATTPVSADRIADLVGEQNARCHCADSVSFFYRVTFADGSIATTASEFATPENVRRIRDTVLVETPGPSRTGPAFPGASGTRASGSPATSQYLVTIVSRLGDRPYMFTHAVFVNATGHPTAAYGYAVPARAAVGQAVNLVLSTQPVLPSTLTRGAKIDSILAVTVRTASRALVFQNNPSVAPHYAATDSVEDRFGGFRFEVAITPDAAERLIIGGLPRSRLPEVLATTFVSFCLLGLLLFQFRKQEELGRLRDDFVSGVSHELRTPLAQIRLLAELLRMGKVPTEAQRERSLAIIDKEARRLSFLVDSILTFTHTEPEKVSTVRTDVRIEIEEIVAGFEPLAQAEGVRLNAELQRDLVADVDRGALRQVLLNLLDNAVRYGPHGQTVTITAQSVGNLWTLTVADEGPGIPANEREHIFAPYYRLQRDAGGAIGGTGIGLSVVQKLVTRHGGRAYVDTVSSGSAGARFVVEFPINQATAKVT